MIPERPILLSATDLDKLMLIVSAAIRVRRRQDFFSWAQGLLHTLLPHDVLICGLRKERSYQLDLFSTAPLSAAYSAFLLAEGGHGLMSRMASAWQRGGQQPLFRERDAQRGNIDDALAADIASFPYSHITAHGVMGLDGEPASLFTLLSLTGGYDASQTYMLEIMAPYLHTAWLRVHLGSVMAVPSEVEGRPDVLTLRELEILRWVHDGKSNIEIGMILDISSLTVKNHVQKILRKLNVQNRTQAVSKSLSLNILHVPPRS